PQPLQVRGDELRLPAAGQRAGPVEALGVPGDLLLGRGDPRLSESAAQPAGGRLHPEERAGEVEDASLEMAFGSCRHVRDPACCNDSCSTAFHGAVTAADAVTTAPP